MQIRTLPIVISMTSESSELYPELKKIEADIETLKILLVRSRKSPKKIAKLEGLLKGKVSVNEEDIEEAKKSVFKFSD
jgi:hypothetical protein